MTDPLIAAARFLAAQLPWLAHARTEQGGPYAADVFAEIRDCASRLRGLVEGPADRRYLGPCGAGVEVEADDEFGDTMLLTVTCDGDVYGVAGAHTGRCRTCGAKYEQADRRIWLDEQVSGSDLAWTARGIADALSINVKTVRAWATPHTSYSGEVLHEAKLRTYYRLGEHIVPWTEPEQGEDVKARGPRLHYVGDVRGLAREAAERRAAGETRETAEMGA
jgi:hypothetical protein